MINADALQIAINHLTKRIDVLKDVEANAFQKWGLCRRRATSPRVKDPSRWTRGAEGWTRTQDAARAERITLIEARQALQDLREKV